VKARLHKFWERNFGKFQGPYTLMISESHASLYYWLQNIHIDELVNYDAHHDLGYPNTKGEVDCGNWAGKLLEEGRVKNYTVVYPAWRKQKRYREQIPDNDRVHVTHTPIEPQDYDLLFIARSGAWTPTWCDDSFIKFCEYWERRYPLSPRVWEEKQTVLNPLKKRNPNMEEAKEEAERMREMYKKMGIYKGNL
jgi:hypothetical protein